MPNFIKILLESIRQSFHELISNKLRSFLSLLGISIGIFCIIGVQAIVDSMAGEITNNLNTLGSDVVYVQRYAWNKMSNGNWWKYLKRPNPNFEDYQVVKAKSKLAERVAYYAVIGRKTLKYKSNSLEGAIVIAFTKEYPEIANIKLDKGRFFSNHESETVSKKVVIGASIAKELFGEINPIKKKIVFNGNQVTVIGVLEKKGDDIISIMNFDDVIFVTYEMGKSLANLKSKYIFDSSLAVKVKPSVSIEDLKWELKGLIRGKHRLGPRDEDDFSINQVDMLTKLIAPVISILNIAGYFIGAFAILVGMFSVANIMFVSVQERTNIIGVKKALGAKHHVILLEFLIESILLCFVGGLMGLFFVFLLGFVLSSVMPFDVAVSFHNLALAFFLSIFIGVLAGVIPAYRASKLNPVDAIRG